MSRYQYETATHAVVVGYDGPLATLFAQAWLRGREAGAEPELWVGAGPPYIKSRPT